MKKRIWIMAIITVLCLCFGVFIPELFFADFASSANNKIETYAVSEKNISISTNILDAIKCVNDSDYCFEYQKDMADMTEDEVWNTVTEYISGLKLEQWGIDKSNIKYKDNANLSCNLLIMVMDDENNVMDADNFYDMSGGDVAVEGIYSDKKKSMMKTKDASAISTVVWQVNVEYQPDNYIKLLVDDKNKKVIYQEVYKKLYSQSKYAYVSYLESDFVSTYVTETLIPFFEMYYDAEINIFETRSNCYSIKLKDRNENIIVLNITFHNELFSIVIDSSNNV